MRRSKNRTKVSGWMGYAVGDFKTSLGHGEVWIGVPVRCYTECNKFGACCSRVIRISKGILNLFYEYFKCRDRRCVFDDCVWEP